MTDLDRLREVMDEAGEAELHGVPAHREYWQARRQAISEAMRIIIEYPSWRNEKGEVK